MFKERIAEVFQFNLALHNESNLNWKYEFPWKGEILTHKLCSRAACINNSLARMGRDSMNLILRTKMKMGLHINSVSEESAH